jgi:hypothetical protein
VVEDWRVCVAGEDGVDDLVDRPVLDAGVAGRSLGLAEPRHPQALEVEELGQGPHRRARAVADGLLVDRDGRREPGAITSSSPLS